MEYGALIFFNFWVWLVSSLCWLYRLSIPSTSVSWKRSLGIGILSSCSMEFTSEVYGPGVYFMERFLTTNLISIVDIGLQKLFLFSSMNSGSVRHSGWLFIYLSSQIFQMFLILVPVESVVMPSPLFLILVMPICLFS